MHKTACSLDQRRRYVRMVPGIPNVGAFTGEVVNCGHCLAACRHLDPAEHLIRTGIALRGPHGLPMYTCKRCGEVDEFTSESEAHGICATCMSYANAPERP
jgi:hypothetical protein